MQAEQYSKEKLIKIRKIFKWILFFALSGKTYLALLGYICIVPICVFILCEQAFLHFLGIKVDEAFELIAIMFYIPIICSTFAMYIYAKIFGVFKFIDNLNIKFLKKIVCLFGISILLMIPLFISAYNIFGNNDYKMNSYCSCHAFSLIPAFLLYKFFQYLTKKYPQPFEIIGYYFSIEFYKKLFIQTFNKFKKN